MKTIWARPMRSATSRKICRPSANEWREKMVEAAAEGDDELLDKFLEDGDALRR